MAHPFAVFLLVTLPAVVGYFAGMLVERVRWNNLIRDGRLPRPGQWRR